MNRLLRRAARVTEIAAPAILSGSREPAIVRARDALALAMRLDGTSVQTIGEAVGLSAAGVEAAVTRGEVGLARRIRQT